MLLSVVFALSGFAAPSWGGMVTMFVCGGLFIAVIAYVMFYSVRATPSCLESRSKFRRVVMPRDSAITIDIRRFRPFGMVDIGIWVTNARFPNGIAVECLGHLDAKRWRERLERMAKMLRNAFGQAVAQ